MCAPLPDGKTSRLPHEPRQRDELGSDSKEDDRPLEHSVAGGEAVSETRFVDLTFFKSRGAMRSDRRPELVVCRCPCTSYSFSNRGPGAAPDVRQRSFRSAQSMSRLTRAESTWPATELDAIDNDQDASFAGNNSRQTAGRENRPRRPVAESPPPCQVWPSLVKLPREALTVGTGHASSQVQSLRLARVRPTRGRPDMAMTTVAPTVWHT